MTGPERLRSMIESYTLHGDFILSSLKETKWYFDPRPAMANAIFRGAVIDAFVAKGFLEGVRGVAGLTWSYPSLVLAGAIASRLDIPLSMVSLQQQPPMPTSLREGEIVGPLPPPGATVLIPCDILVTARSSLVAASVLERHGLRPRFGVVVDRATETLRSVIAERALDFRALFHWQEFHEFQDETRLQPERIEEQWKRVTQRYPEPSLAALPIPAAGISPLELRAIDIALAKALESTQEPGKLLPSPKVGCVVIRGGEILAATHRNEDGNGMHAEEYALEVQLANEDLSGATLVTTLEPCTARPRHTCCFDLLKSRGIQRVIIGTVDPDKRITGQGEMDSLESHIQTVRFPPEQLERAWNLNEEFIKSRRQASL